MNSSITNSYGSSDSNHICQTMVMRENVFDTRKSLEIKQAIFYGTIPLQ